MKNNFFLVYLTILCCVLNSQIKAQGKLIFNYDEAGNQVKRTYCIKCPTTTSSMIESLADSKISDQNLNKLSESDFFIYYPNPTKDVVNIKLIDKQKVNSISVYSISGLLLKTVLVQNQSSNQFSIDISNQPQGIYLLVFNLIDGTNFSKKIIKL